MADNRIFCPHCEYRQWVLREVGGHLYVECPCCKKGTPLLIALGSQSLFLALQGKDPPPGLDPIRPTGFEPWRH